jgi:2-oxoglutarate ferredoxin oxidoreductase subunit alpha
MDRLVHKFDTARSHVPKPEMVQNGKSEVGIIGYGTSHWALVESRDQLRNEYGVETDYLRLRAYPFNRDVHEFINSHSRVYVIDQNRDAQMLSLLKLDIDPRQAPRLRSVRHYNGLPIDARSVTDEIISQEGK